MTEERTNDREDEVSEEHSAYRRAYALFDAVQGEQRRQAVAELPAALARADAEGWGQVGFVLSAAGVAHTLTRADGGPADGESERLVALLVARAETLGRPALTATALGLRALAAAAAGDTAAQLSDASVAVAMLDDESLPALERCTAYLVVAASYNTLRLWELVDDLYAQALDVGSAPEAAEAAEALAAVVVNRALTRLERALALVEVGDDAAARDELARVREAVAASAGAGLTTMWVLDLRACDLVARLLLEPWSTALERDVTVLRSELSAVDDIEALPLLVAASALALWRADEHGKALALAEPLGTTPSASSGARSFPLWVRAQVLAAVEPSAAVDAQLEHARAVGRLLHESRHAVLASAGAQIAVERRQAEHDRLFRDVHTDPLTGLLNRRSFDSWLSPGGDAGHPAATLLLVDLDGFKQVNDTHGHGVGDEVLRTVGRLMRSSVRFGDLAMRHGGDEFAVLLADPALSPGAAMDRARDLADAIAHADWSELAVGLSVSVSIGVAGAVTADGRQRPDAASVYRAADAALYSAKRTGSRIALAG